ncbi:glutaredoxin [Shewanella sp. WXL01]|uniref:Glutaredoxin n=1 Tax=Shewanella maritima TaxID=2520507 RepID=A0A411PLF1_9GAMM|nr:MULTISPECIES: glutathione S-transferase N-terminal domain-containing protein [Shewanella]NKF52475.1 glutaredoxin [Shewanella sp. WXL01]QBF84341.1 glutaredoxin [Shewanella maritima]
MFIIRWILGRIILFFDFVFSPKKRQRPVTEQQRIDQATQSLSLYQYKACPFCVKVRREMRRQSLNITTIDAKQEQNKNELETQGGKLQVPCLKIVEDGQTQWLYESSEIIGYLNQKFA